jgi:hypothetical protein
MQLSTHELISTVSYLRAFDHFNTLFPFLLQLLQFDLWKLLHVPAQTVRYHQVLTRNWDGSKSYYDMSTCIICYWETWKSRQSRSWYKHYDTELIFPAALWPWGRPSLQQKWMLGTPQGCKDSRCVGLTDLPPSCADCLNILEASTPWSPNDLSRSI